MKTLIFSLVLASIVLVSSCNSEKYDLLTRINVEQDKEGKLIDSLLVNIEQSIKAKASNDDEKYLRLDSAYNIKRRELDSISKVSTKLLNEYLLKYYGVGYENIKDK